MPDENFLSTLENNMSSFSKRQRQVAEYILRFYDRAAYMTAGRLAEAVKVSESTVVRFAMELGYDGYPQMQKALRDIVRPKLTSVQRMRILGAISSDGEILSHVMNQDMEKLRHSYEELETEAFRKAADSISGAGRVYIVGMRSSSTLARYLFFYLNILRDNVIMVDTASESELFEQMFRIGGGDVAVGISYPRYSRKTLTAMRFARDRGARVIAVTDGAISPIVKLADLTLYARSEMASFVDSLVAPMSLINALVVAVSVRNEKVTEQTLRKLEDIWDEYDIYEKLHDD